MLAGFIEELLAAGTLSDIRAVFMAAAAQFGFENTFYTARFMLTVPSSLLREPPVILSNAPVAVLEEVRQLRDLEKDGWVRWVMEHDGDISSAELQEQWPSPSLQVAAKHGLGAVHILSLRERVLHSAGAVLLNPHAGADDKVLAQRWRQSGRDIRVLSWIMHMRVATMPRKQFMTTLTPRQREVLGWRSAGKTVDEIAIILGITPATVEKHLRLARESLGVETTPQAVLKAHVTHQLHNPEIALRG
nr:LuxR family transcriptional regulator [Paracoccus saliphilus]